MNTRSRPWGSTARVVPNFFTTPTEHVGATLVLMSVVYAGAADCLSIRSRRVRLDRRSVGRMVVPFVSVTWSIWRETRGEISVSEA